MSGKGKIQYRLTELGTTSEQTPLSIDPVFPSALVPSDRKLIGVSHQGNSQQQRLLRELLEPAVVRKLRIAEAELSKSLGIFVEKQHHTKFLSKSSQLSERGRSFHQVDEMGFDSAFREKAESFSGVRAFSDPKDLYFQDRTLDVFRNDLAGTINSPSVDQWRVT